MNMMVALLAFPATEAPSTDSPLEALRKEMVNQSSAASSAETDEADAPEGIFQYLRFEQFATIEDLRSGCKWNMKTTITSDGNNKQQDGSQHQSDIEDSNKPHSGGSLQLCGWLNTAAAQSTNYRQTDRRLTACESNCYHWIAV